MDVAKPPKLGVSATRPWASSLLAKVLDLASCTNSWFMRSTMTAGVPVGATKLKELWVLRSGTPASVRVGTPGNNGVRCSSARAETLPERIKDSAEATSANMN